MTNIRSYEGQYNEIVVADNDYIPYRTFSTIDEMIEMFPESIIARVEAGTELWVIV